jgi:hypothetical protein
MTLAEWTEKSPIVPQLHKDGFSVWVAYLGSSDPIYRELWRLSDYRVTSVAAGSIWLVPKK